MVFFDPVESHVEPQVEGPLSEQVNLLLDRRNVNWLSIFTAAKELGFVPPGKETQAMNKVFRGHLRNLDYV